MMLLKLVFALATIAALLLVTEYLWRQHKLHVETSRKIVHIGTGLVIAFWPYFLSWSVIQLLAVVMFVAVLCSHQFRIFKSIHSVKRLTRGEILYPLGIAICAFIEPAPWMFTIAMLHLAIADGIAAIVGVRHGKKSRYSMFGHGKSLAGSFAFFVSSLAIFALASLLLHDTLLAVSVGWLVTAALSLTLIESISWYGLDDITVPIAVIVLLSLA